MLFYHGQIYRRSVQPLGKAWLSGANGFHRPFAYVGETDKGTTQIEVAERRVFSEPACLVPLPDS